MSEDQERGFVIRDKRGASELSSKPSPATAAEPSPTTAPPSSASSHEDHDAKIPLTFSSFILSLGTSTLMLLGETLALDQPATPVNLPQAKEIIEILSMLETKTKGNLAPDEATVLRDMLYTLRMKYVERASGTGK